MVETRDWNSTPEALQQLEGKLESYSQFILSGSLASQHPELAKKPVCIRLEHFSPITEKITLVLGRWARRVAGIPVGIASHRSYWNAVMAFMQTITSKLKGADEMVRWTPEAGAALVLRCVDKISKGFGNLRLQPAGPRSV